MSEPGPPVWEQRYRAATFRVPEWASEDPDRAMVVTASEGVLQVHAWTPSSGRLIAATGRPRGTVHGHIDPSGRWLWWFDDTDGDERGSWRRQPFGTTPARRAEHPVPLAPAHPAGLLLGADDLAVVGRTTPTGTEVHAVGVGADRVGETPTLLYAHPQPARAAALSADDRLVVVQHTERGDARHPALRVVRTADGRGVADLDDGPDRGLRACGFSAVPGDARLLVRHERAGAGRLLVWDVAQGLQRPVELGLPGEVVDAWWYPDARHLLVAVSHEARTRLHRLDLHAGTTTPVGPTDGTVVGAVPRPDGDVWVVHSSAARPRALLSGTTQRPVVSPPGPPPPPSVPAVDLWTEGPGGRIHSLLRLPGTGVAPYPLVVEVHGGPARHSTDAFSASAAAWVDHGWAVLSVNYRGSTGYGSAWRDALTGRVGLTELADVAAVHDALVADGTADPARCVLVGGSWGGYLTLLGLGTQPERWAGGVAVSPIADYVAAYEDELEDLQAFDRALFGGSPQEVPEAYARSSPITYADRVRVPVLVIAGDRDPRCPSRQVERYLDRMRSRGKDVAVHRHDAGHGSLVDDERVAQMRRVLDFVSDRVARPLDDQG